MNNFSSMVCNIFKLRVKKVGRSFPALKFWFVVLVYSLKILLGRGWWILTGAVD